MLDFFAGEYMAQKIVEERLFASREHFATPRPENARRGRGIGAQIETWAGQVAAALRASRQPVARRATRAAH